MLLVFVCEMGTTVLKRKGIFFSDFQHPLQPEVFPWHKGPAGWGAGVR